MRLILILLIGCCVAASSHAWLDFSAFSVPDSSSHDNHHTSHQDPENPASHTHHGDSSSTGHSHGSHSRQHGNETNTSTQPEKLEASDNSKESSSPKSEHSSTSPKQHHQHHHQPHHHHHKAKESPADHNNVKHESVQGKVEKKCGKHTQDNKHTNPSSAKDQEQKNCNEHPYPNNEDVSGVHDPHHHSYHRHHHLHHKHHGSSEHGGHPHDSLYSLEHHGFWPSSGELSIQPCPLLYTRIGHRCIAIFSIGQTSWSGANSFCESIYGELVVFKNIQEYLEFLEFLQISDLNLDLWVGGKTDGRSWKWIDGSRMPMGSPYWAIRTNLFPSWRTNEEHYYQSPSKIVTPHAGLYQSMCASMSSKYYYYMSDEDCDDRRSPVCVLKNDAEIVVLKQWAENGDIPTENLGTVTSSPDSDDSPTSVESTEEDEEEPSEEDGEESTEKDGEEPTGTDGEEPTEEDGEEPTEKDGEEPTEKDGEEPTEKDEDEASGDEDDEDSSEESQSKESGEGSGEVEWLDGFEFDSEGKED